MKVLDYLQHLTDLLFKSVSDLAKQAGVLIEHLWIVFTRQQLLLGLQQLLTGLAMIIGAFFTYKVFQKYGSKTKMNNVDRYALMAIFFIITVVLVIKGLTFSIDSVTRLINPEYHALIEAIQLLQKVSQ